MTIPVIPTPSDLKKVDPRRSAFRKFDPSMGGERSADIYDVHGVLSSLRLHDDLPDDIRRHLGIACRCAMFSIYEYDLVIPMFLHAAAATERALRYYYGEEKTAFKNLLEKAVRHRLVSKDTLHNTRYRHENVRSINWEDIEKNLLKLLPEFRNSFAHATSSIVELADLLPACFDIINACMAARKSPMPHE